MVSPVTVTVMLLPTFLVANVPAAPLVPSVTASPVSTPDRLAEVSPTSVAVVLPLYVLLDAVIPVTVIGTRRDGLGRRAAAAGEARAGRVGGGDGVAGGDVEGLRAGGQGPGGGRAAAAGRGAQSQVGAGRGVVEIDAAGGGRGAAALGGDGGREGDGGAVSADVLDAVTTVAVSPSRTMFAVVVGCVAACSCWPGPR